MVHDTCNLKNLLVTKCTYDFNFRWPKNRPIENERYRISKKQKQKQQKKNPGKHYPKIVRIDKYGQHNKDMPCPLTMNANNTLIDDLIVSNFRKESWNTRNHWRDKFDNIFRIHSYQSSICHFQIPWCLVNIGMMNKLGTWVFLTWEISCNLGWKDPSQHGECGWFNNYWRTHGGFHLSSLQDHTRHSNNMIWLCDTLCQ